MKWLNQYDIVSISILMDFPIFGDRLSIELLILYFTGSREKFLNYLISLKTVQTVNEMPHHAAFHLGLHCLTKYLFADIQNEKG